jgi:hypothetical protein
MNNNKESDDELIDSIVESIAQKQSEEKGKYYIDEVTLTFMYLSEFLEAIKKNADAHLEKIKLDNIYNQFNLIKEITNDVLIATISNNYPSISKDQKEIEENILIIKQNTLDELLNLSFKNDYKLISTMLALVIKRVA